MSQLGRIYLDMLNVYKVMSDNMSAAIALNGEIVLKQPLIKGMRVVRRETLKLITDWISRSNDHQVVRFIIHYFSLNNNLLTFLIAILLILGFGQFYTTIIRRSAIGLSKNEYSMCQRTRSVKCNGYNSQ